MIEDIQTDAYLTEENEKVQGTTLEEARSEILGILQKLRESEARIHGNSMKSMSTITNLKAFSRFLRIKVQNSSTLPKSLVLNISSFGLENTKRLAQDGIVYFGSKRKSSPKGQVTSDFVIPINTSTRFPQFAIYFHPQKCAFFLKDLGQGFGTFVKLSSTLVLENNQLLNMGDSFLIVNIFKKLPEDSFPTLCLKIYSGVKIGEVKYFYAPEHDVKEIYIGRGKECQVSIDDVMISNKQSTIFFSLKGWMLVDGDLSVQRPSTNGTW